MGKNIKEISQIASEWWADKITDPKFDNGDNSESGFLATSLAKMGTKSVSSESRDNFISILRDKIEQELNKEEVNTKWMPSVMLNVDYGPCSMLAESARSAGISKTNFPWKTTMWIDRDHVSVSYGYRAKEEFLYANKAFWQRCIESLKERVKEYGNGTMLSWIKNEEERKATAKERISDIEKTIAECQVNLDKAED